MVRILSLLLLAVCITGYFAQESQESAEGGGGGAGGGAGGGGGANQPPASAEENEAEGANNPPPGGATQPGGIINPTGGNLNPLHLTGRQLQLFNARLNFVRSELTILGQTIGRFLFFGQEQRIF